MRTGAEYREALRDGRRVFVMGEGLIEDVTVHPATRPMVDEYVTWYDRHLDPAWADVVLTPPDAGGVRAPWASPSRRARPTCARWAAATRQRSSRPPAT